MVLIRNFDEISGYKHPVVLTVGFFDGVHRGHQHLLSRLKQFAGRHNAEPMVITFANSPRSFHQPQEKTRYLTMWHEKINLLFTGGAEIVAMLKYDESIASQTAEKFIRGIMSHLKVRGICVGYDSSIGCDMLRGEQAFRALADRLGIACEFVGPFEFEGEPVKSSQARELLAAGKIERYLELMDHHYFIEAKVEHGKGMGRSKIEIPTANLYLPPEKLAPPVGIYAAIADVTDSAKSITKRRSYPAATCVMNARLATNTVLDKDGPSTDLNHNPQITVVEAHLIGFEGDLYGKTIRLRFLRHLRDWINFDTPEQLHCQIKEDIAASRAAALLEPDFAGGHNAENS